MPWRDPGQRNCLIQLLRPAACAAIVLSQAAQRAGISLICLCRTCLPRVQIHRLQALPKRRCQRIRLREALLREGGKLYEEQTQPWLCLGDTYRQDVQEASCIRLEQTLQRQLEERHILCRDIEEAVLAAEASRSWCLNTLNGHRVGWHRPRKVTFWVEYAPCERTDSAVSYHVYDAWCHRMTIEP